MRSALFHFLRLSMYIVPLDIYRFIGNSGTNIFTSATAYAEGCIDLRDRKPFAFFVRNHRYGLCGTMLGAGTATLMQLGYDAVFDKKNHMSWLGNMFLFDCQRAKRTGGANVRAQSTIEIAETFFKTHSRLQEAGKAILGKCRDKYMTWAFAYAQVATRAVIGKAVSADSPRRR